MCQEPTELLWIGCLTGLILILKFKFDTLIPNINSQKILTRGNFTHDEWNNLLHLLNISHFSSSCCTENSSLTSYSKTVAKKDAGAKRETKKCGKMEIHSDELVFSCSYKFLIREKSDCIQRSGDTHSYGETCKQDEKKFKIRRNIEFSSATARCIPSLQK